MDHKSHVRLVNAHPKGDGGAHNLGLVLEPAVLRRGSLLPSQASVIGLGFDPCLPHILSRVVTVLLGQTVDDAGFVSKLLLNYI